MKRPVCVRVLDVDLHPGGDSWAEGGIPTEPKCGLRLQPRVRSDVAGIVNAGPLT